MKQLRNARHNLMFAFMFCGFFLFTSVSAQTQSSAKPFTFPKYALEFRIQTQNNVRSFKGLTGVLFSGRLQIGRRSALRLGISEDLHHEESKLNSIKESSQSDNDTLKYKNSYQNTLHGLHLDYLFYPFPNRGIKWYVGGGAGFAFNSDTQGNHGQKFERKTYMYSLKMLGGVEWFIKKIFSLHLEYGLVVQYLHHSVFNNRNPFSRTYKSKSDAFDITPSEILFGLSFYFQ